VQPVVKQERVPAPITLWTRAHCSTSSQYSVGSTGGCTIAALESALQLLTSFRQNTPVSTALVNDALRAASQYKCDLHTGLEDVLPLVDRYKYSLKEGISDQLWLE